MHKYLLDENLSRKLIQLVGDKFPGISHVSNEGFANSADSEIWNIAKSKGYTLVTKDNDFLDMSHIFGCPPKVVKLNCGNKTTEYIGNLLLTHHSQIQEFAEGELCYMEIV